MITRPPRRAVKRGAARKAASAIGRPRSVKRWTLCLLWLCQAKARQCAPLQLSGIGYPCHDQLREPSAQLHSSLTISLGFAARLVIRFDNIPNVVEGVLDGSRYLGIANSPGSRFEVPVSLMLLYEA